MKKKKQDVDLLSSFQSMSTIEKQAVGNTLFGVGIGGFFLLVCLSVTVLGDNIGWYWYLIPIAVMLLGTYIRRSI